MRFRCIAAALVGTLLVAGPGATAEKPKDHAFTRQRTDTMDLVVSLDWDWRKDSQWNRQMLEATFQRFGQKAAGMTEGRVRICNLYVFPNREQWQKSDIRVHRVAEGEKPGRAGSVAGGLGKANAWINATTGYYGAGEFEARALDFRLSNTLTHELGHYAFGLLDEYHERDVKKQATDVGVPRVTDVTLDTIMGRSQDFDAVSTPADYSKLVDGKNPREHTAQYRAWGMSGWEFLTVEEGKLAKSLGLKAGRERIKWAPLGGSAMPDNPLGNAPPGWDACFGIHFMVGKSIALILDDSGSTLQNPGSPNTPTDREIILQEGVAFVRTLEAGDRLQIWGHSDPIFPLSVIESDAPDGPVKQQAIAAIQAHSVEGPRGYYVALAKAVGALLDKDDARVHFGERRYALVISDADRENGISAEITGVLKPLSMPVYGLAISGAGDISGLASTTSQTQGRTWRYPGTKGDRLYANIAEDLVPREVLGFQGFEDLGLDQDSPLSVHVSELDQEVRFLAGWNVGDTTSFRVTGPDGKELDPQALPANVSYVDEGEEVFYRVTKPAPGIWTTSVSQSVQSPFHVAYQRASVVSPVEVSLGVQGEGYPEPVRLTARVAAPDPVIGASVVAEFTVPAGAMAVPDQVLRDDGGGADATKDDGVYTGVLPSTLKGDYPIVVSVKAEAGVAQLLPGGELPLDEPEAEPLIPKPVPSFERTAEITYVEGYVVEQPTSQDLADGLPAGGGAWGDVTPDHPKLWYELNPNPGQRLYLMTSGLWATDGGRMVTRLQILDSDGVTVLAESQDFEGQGISWLSWKAPGSGPYWVTVEHASGGSGRFLLSSSRFDQRPGIDHGAKSKHDSGDSGSCRLTVRRLGHSGSASGLGLLLVGGLAAWRRRRDASRPRLPSTVAGSTGCAAPPKS